MLPKTGELPTVWAQKSPMQRPTLVNSTRRRSSEVSITKRRPTMLTAICKRTRLWPPKRSARTTRWASSKLSVASCSTRKKRTPRSRCSWWTQIRRPATTWSVTMSIIKNWWRQTTSRIMITIRWALTLPIRSTRSPYTKANRKNHLLSTKKIEISSLLVRWGQTRMFTIGLSKWRFGSITEVKKSLEVLLLLLTVSIIMKARRLASWPPKHPRHRLLKQAMLSHLSFSFSHKGASHHLCVNFQTRLKLKPSGCRNSRATRGYVKGVF